MSRKRKRQYDSIDKALSQAEESTVPFVMADEEIAVVGDANETEVSKYDFTISFRIPKDGGGSETKVKEFKNVFISPRKELKAEKALIPILSYFRRVENGEVTALTDDDKTALAMSIDEEFLDYAYDLVGVVLGIDDELKEYMEIDSVLKAVEGIIRAYPSMVNAADTFFD